ncbi:TPA: phenol degradation protein [Pseudomonas aeruginosa]|uniref:SphA family protein n=1 Tax=Pseudomonas TaxID=286 RepID=UPI00053DD583|nr:MULTISPECIES: transporter [Pseudomonas]EKL0662028.1 transporter [Pseudomonas aeruginosa]EKL8242622.1 transporter [Pseudomonas aeruginosa]EKL8600940.1 transporter [Pseudomonas aeruginosa]EKP5713830.1 transporter [Pseudomonas aeruginosa]EKT0600918.1 transporter [Pseudomonas aeruginosa]
MITRIRASLLALPLLLPSFQAIAALPGMNLGQTSFLDGKALPGTLFQQFVNIYEADDFMDANGHRRPLDNRLRTLLATSHFAHISQHQLFGAYYGAEILVPVLLADPDFEPHAGSANGLGNLIVSPFILQWPQTELFGRPYWQRLNLALQLPTGRYDRHRAINPGSNHWSFNPHYALTWEFAEGWEASARLQYLLPGKNRDPAPPLADDYLQPGQAFHANYSVSLALDAHWRLGLSGYSLRQITDERVDGHDRPDSRERVDAIGPALMFGWGKSRLFLNAYHEYGARNRSEGSRLILRYSQVF